MGAYASHHNVYFVHLIRCLLLGYVFNILIALCFNIGHFAAAVADQVKVSVKSAVVSVAAVGYGNMTYHADFA